MIRRWLGLLCCLLCCLLGTAAHAAQADCPPLARAPDAAELQAARLSARDRGFLWRIEKGGRVSHLYGTLHVGKLDWAFPGPRVARAFEASDTLALELDLLDADLVQRLISAIAARITVALPEPLTRRLRRLSDLACIAPEVTAGLGPELHTATLTSLAARRDGLDPAFGVDLLLSGRARAAGTRVVSLETSEAQLRALQLDDAAERVRSVESALDDIESGRAAVQVNHLARVWAEGDLATLARYEDWCDCLATPADRAAMARLLDERNPALADGIAALHEGGERVFAAVGSLHMVGPGGLPALLTRRGYRVERITLDSP